MPSQHITSICMNAGGARDEKGRITIQTLAAKHSARAKEITHNTKDNSREIMPSFLMVSPSKYRAGAPSARSQEFSSDHSPPRYSHRSSGSSFQLQTLRTTPLSSDWRQEASDSRPIETATPRSVRVRLFPCLMRYENARPLCASA